MDALDGLNLEEMMKLYGLQQNQPILGDQIAQAQALQQGQANPYATGDAAKAGWGGALLQGAAGALDRTVGAYREKGLRADQQKNLGDQQAQLLALAQALRARGQPAQQAPTGDLPDPISRFRMGGANDEYGYEG